MKLGLVEISSSVFFLIYSKSSFIILTCRLNAASIQFILSTQFYLDEILFFLLSSQWRRSLLTILILLWIWYERKTETIKIKPWSFHSRTAVHAGDEQRFSKANEIRAFYSFDTSVKSVNLFNFFTRNVFLFLRSKTSNKHLISLEFSVRAVSYGSSFFP